jgi:quercetin dioxygenase-like cupin family protein
MRIVTIFTLSLFLLLLTACQAETTPLAASPAEDEAPPVALPAEDEAPAAAAMAEDEAPASPAEDEAPPAATEAEAEPEPISVRPLTQRHEFTDDVAIQITLNVEGREQEVIDFADASNIAVFEFTIQPGARFPWHTHPGTPLITVIEGDFVFVYADDCVERHYPAGTAVVDPGFDNVHMAYNPSEENVTVVIVTFIGAPLEGPITLAVDEDEEAEINERCGFEAVTHSH